jgi:hypothetical protein
LLQKVLQVSPPIKDAVDIDACFDDLTNYPVRLEEDFSKIGDPTINKPLIGALERKYHIILDAAANLWQKLH